MRLQKRLEQLEAADQQRQARVYDRVLHQLTDDELDTFTACLERWQVDPLVAIDEGEQRVVCRVEALTTADREARPGDLMGVPREWMEVTGNV